MASKKTEATLDEVTAAGSAIGGLVFRPLPIRAASEFVKLCEQKIPTANVLLLTPRAFVRVYREGTDGTATTMDEQTATEIRKHYAREHADLLMEVIAQFSGHPVQALEKLTTSELLQAVDVMLENPF